MRWQLRIELLSDATFGRGDGMAGQVDSEVEHDPATGLPFIRGRVLKGLLVEECANILFALQKQKSPVLARLEEAAQFLFGSAGSTLDADARMQVGAARLPEPLRRAVAADVVAKRLAPAQVLESLTAIRRQTAVNENGAPEQGSLRAMRVLLRDTHLTAALSFDAQPATAQRALLAACVLALRRGGAGRNRGRGRLRATLNDEAWTTTAFEEFRALVASAGGAS